MRAKKRLAFRSTIAERMAAPAPALWFSMLIGIVAELVVCGGGGSTPNDPRNPSAAAPLTGGEVDGGGATVIESKLAVSDTAVLDFGTAVAVSGDLLVSTAPRSTIGGGVYAGAAQVYLRDPTSNQWLAQRQLVPYDSAANDEFGLTASADGETVAVGAPNAQVDSVFQQGAVYLFERNRGGADQWGEVVKLTDGSVGFEGHFGASVALSGDLLVVGATMPPHGGKVMIFERNRGGPDAWGNVATILDSDTGDGGLNEAFGSAVAIDGDLLLIGASMADVSYYNENDGAAYLFARDAIDRDRWAFVARLAAAEALACTSGATLADLARNSPDGLAAAQQCARDYSRSDNDAFGGAIALKGDVAAVGAHCAEGGDSSATPIYCAGAVYVFRHDPATSQWTQEAKLASSPAGVFSYFGDSLALTSDLLLIGAHGASVDGKLAQGQAHVFQHDAVSGSWLDTQTLTASDGLSNDGFATSVTLSGSTMIAGAPRQQGGRGAVYLYQAPAPAPPAPPPCPPLVSATDTLQDGTTLTSSTGLVLAASTGTLSAPAPLYIREVPAPAASIWDGAAAVGSYYEVGVAGCSVSSSPMHPFAMSLPVPEGVPADGLAVAALVPGSALVDAPGTDRSWEPTVGVYDAEHRLYQISLGGLLNEGTTFVLVQDPNLAPAPPSETAARTSATAAPTPTFWIYNSGVSTDQFNQAVPVLQSAFADAYAVYQKNGFPLADPTGYENYEQGPGTPFINVYVRPSNGGRCDGLVGGYYNDGLLSITICLSPIMPVPLPIVAAHELFHAVQRGYFAWYNAWRLLQSEDWIVEGSADLAAGTAVGASVFPSPVHRTDIFRPRRADVSLLAPRGDPISIAPYGTQDFWAHLLLQSHDVAPRNYTLDELDRFLRSGETTAAIAARLNVPSPTYQPLGDEYWAWAKNQVIEKNETFDGALKDPCQMDQFLISADPVFTYPATSSALGAVDYLQTRWVQIVFTTEAAPVTIRVESAGSDVVYKVYLESEKLDSQGHPRCQTTLPGEMLVDGERRFDVLPAGSVVDILVAYKAYASPAAAPLAYKVEVLGADPQ